jgi:hypothetical protein
MTKRLYEESSTIKIFTFVMSDMGGATGFNSGGVITAPSASTSYAFLDSVLLISGGRAVR